MTKAEVSAHWTVIARGALQMSEYIARRLTPTECARLQGFPDDWTDIDFNGKEPSDAAKYKLWGNGIALPCLLPMFAAMRKILEEHDEI